MSPAGISFRDPAGSCVVLPNRVYRFLDATNAAVCEGFLQTECARKFAARRALVSARRLNASEISFLQETEELEAIFAAHAGQTVFEHERIAFVGYPYEWPPEMLWEAARLTLELGRAALAEGYGLKDATPYNVLFRGPRAVFVDVPSFERRDAADSVWLAQGQLVRTFLLPLLANRRWRFELADIFMTHRDGLEPEEVYLWSGFFERLSPKMLSLVSLPTWLRSRAQTQGSRLYESRRLAEPEKAQFILNSLLKRMERTLDSLKPARRTKSAWSDYMATHSYSEPAFAEKEKFVDEALRESKPKRVLDIGANTGHFSARAAKAGAEVVAIDIDSACAGRIWERANEENLNILPLVVDLSRPTPALGWNNCECPSFLERSRGAFDCVLMLAVIHHLLVTERIPLREILRLVSELTSAWLVLELVGPEDEMFRQLTRGREALHAGLTRESFEQACAPHFDVVRSLPLVGKARWVYFLKRKGREI